MKTLSSITEGTQLIVTQDVALSTEGKSGPRWSSTERLAVPKGTTITYIGQYYWGSDPGPGFPLFNVNGKKAYAANSTLSHWGNILPGWCEPV
jgi:hypothetical protein